MMKYLVRILVGTSFVAMPLIFSGCAHSTKDGPPRYYVDVSKIPNAVPQRLPKSHYGNPKYYVVSGRKYHVLPTANGYFKRGVASWYGTKFHGRKTSSREPYDVYAMTGASTDLPIPSFVRVTNLQNHRSVIVKINDRGPFAANRILDLSYAAAMKLGYADKGTAFVEVKSITFDEHYQPHTERVYLQLGAFRSLSNAQSLKSRAAELIHKPIVILKGLHQQSHLYRVLIPVIGIGESSRLHMQLKKMGFGKVVQVMS